MSEEVLVKVEGVSKKFCRSLKRSLWYGVQDVANEALGRDGHHDELRKNEFWAVNDISFELKRGECLGLIGPNGAGKSTLLKMLNGLVKPDQGRIIMRGRVGALIELGAGFNPILTGRENIYVNGSVLGFSKKEIDRKFDAIVDFAEIEEFIDTPVQNYSSGMRMRLGFAVAAQMEPDVLLIDEVLAVGDVGFRAKCYDVIADLAENTSVVFVSHQMTHVSRVANRILLIDHGIASTYGVISEGISNYLRLFDDHNPTRHGSGEVRIEELLVNGTTDSLEVPFGHSIKFEAVVNCSESLEFLVVNFAFLSLDGSMVAECNNFTRQVPLSASQGRKYLLKVTIPSLQLSPGSYHLSCLVASHNMLRHFDWHRKCRRINVAGNQLTGSPVQFQGEWQFQPVEQH